MVDLGWVCLQGITGEVYNIGTEKERTVKDVSAQHRLFLQHACMPPHHVRPNQVFPLDVAGMWGWHFFWLGQT